MSVFTTNQQDPAMYQWHKNNKQDDLECSKVLEWMWECYRPVGWLRSVYRDGQASPCEVSFSDFQYCLKLKSMSKEDADASMQERFPPCHKRYAGKHVWEFREPMADDAAPVSSSASSSFPPPGVMSFTGSVSAGPPASNTPEVSARSFVSSSDLMGAASATAAWKQLSNCRSCEALLTPL